MSERSSTSRRASQTRSSPASNRYIRGEDVSAAVMGVDRFGVDADMNEADEATSRQGNDDKGLVTVAVRPVCDDRRQYFVLGPGRQSHYL